MRQKETTYTSASEWLKNNRKKLGRYAGEWIAITNTGVHAHGKSGHIVREQARTMNLDYTLKYVHPLEVSRIVRLL